MGKGHVKFDEDESAANAAAITDRKDTMQVISKNNEQTHLDSDEESDEDDAPQEEGLHSGKNEIESRFTEREEAIRSEQSQLKSKRRKQNELYAKQKKAINEAEVVEETIAELPEELLDNIDQREESSAQNLSSMHINFDKFEDSDEEEEEAAKATKARKRKTLKNLRKDSVKRGKFKIQLLPTTQDSKALPPKKESSIINSRDRWLNRKTLNKR
ncbi:hypothetical protein N7582_002577 [Saccharomyces uvarum]|uniref:Bud21p n=1 Tax=Saccharomyces uvarum TaxID=230603 RepID=A0AA35NRI7_SACUV|nr:hypothetical protein N7582_002577 [Saccharomyces uvarum]CAI4064090.1 hypothetical protein SUVC_08G1170 [Saccharomyces uvarum]